MRYFPIIFVIVALIGCGKDKNPSGPTSTPDPNDTQAPYVQITYPAEGQVFAHGTSSIKIAITAHDDVAVQGVEVYVNASLKVYDNSAPYSFTIYNPSGGYRVCARAYDKTGKSNQDCVNFSVQ